MIAGTCLGFFDTSAVQITGAALNGAGFLVSQGTDYLHNRAERKKIADLEEELRKLKAQKQNGHFVPCLIESWHHYYGLNHTVTDISISVILGLLNSLLLLTSSACAGYRSTLGDNSSNSIPDILLTTAMVVTFALGTFSDKIEQHYKKDNLSLRKDRLKTAIEFLKNQADLSSSTALSTTNNRR